MSKRREQQKEQLKRKLAEMLENYNSVHHMAVANGDCYGLVYRCLNGGFSPTLYQKYIRPEPRKRERLIIPATAETVARFDAICDAESVTRRDLLAWMVRNYEESNTGDYAELEY
jgi:hypothetical protein